MRLFGGDPRSAYFKTLLQINKWYVLILILLFLSTYPIRKSDKTFGITFFLFSAVELIRIGLMHSYRRGSVQFFVAFLIITVIPMLVLDFLWMFFVETRSEFDFVILIGMSIIHSLEILWSLLAIRSLSRFQTRFYRFQYGYRQVDDGIALGQEPGAGSM